MLSRTPKAIEDARHMVANFDKFLDVPVDTQLRLRALCWHILKTAQGKPTRQSRRVVVKPAFGGDVA
jgi:hypothetical protein